MTTLLDEIRRAQAEAALRVINGGMKQSLHMAQVLAGEEVVVASLDLLREKLKLDGPADPMASPESAAQARDKPADE